MPRSRLSVAVRTSLDLSRDAATLRVPAGLEPPAFPAFTGSVSFQPTVGVAGAYSFAQNFTNSPTSYAIAGNVLPNGFTFNTSSGLLSWDDTITEQSVPGFFVTASNAAGVGGNSSTPDFDIDVVAQGANFGTIAEFQLQPNHFPPSRTPLEIVHPRPNSDPLVTPNTSHVIGVPGRKYQERVVLRGGTGAMMARLTQGPAGATIGGRAIGLWSGWESDGTRRFLPSFVESTGARNRYLCIEYDAPATTQQVTWTLEVRDHVGETRSVTWTTNFNANLWAVVVANAAPGGDGSLATPYNSLEQITDSGTTRGVWMDTTGNYELFATSGSSNFTTDGTNNPYTFAGNPNAVAVLDLPSVWLRTTAGGPPLHVKNLELQHTTNARDSMKMMSAGSSYCAIRDCHISNFEDGNGTNGENPGVYYVTGGNFKEYGHYAFNRHSGQQGPAWQVYDLRFGACFYNEWSDLCNFSEFGNSRQGTIHAKDSNHDCNFEANDFRRPGGAAHIYSAAHYGDMSSLGQGLNDERNTRRLNYLTSPDFSQGAGQSRASSYRQLSNNPAWSLINDWFEFNTVNTYRAEFNASAPASTGNIINRNILYGDVFDANEPGVSETNNLTATDSVEVDDELQLTAAFLAANPSVVPGQQGAGLV